MKNKKALLSTKKCKKSKWISESPLVALQRTSGLESVYCGF
jgi:hypothetical protein